MNYNKSLVEQFTFIILLATLNTLVPYIFCTMSEVMIYIKDPARFSGKRLGRRARDLDSGLRLLALGDRRRRARRSCTGGSSPDGRSSGLRMDPVEARRSLVRRLWPLLVKVRLRLERVREPQDRRLVEMPSDELDAYR